MHIQPIGVVHQLRDGGAQIDILPEFEDGLDGLKPGDRIDILYWMHRLTESDYQRLQVHPRGDKDRPKQGVFGLRSPMRPNPIGVTSVEILNIEGTRLVVQGLDALDGSPVVDIKRERAGQNRLIPTKG